MSSEARACECGRWFRGDSGAKPGASVKATVTAAGRDATHAPLGSQLPPPPPSFSHDLTQLFLSPSYSTTVLDPKRVHGGSVDQGLAGAGAGAVPLHPYLAVIHTWMQRLQAHFHSQCGPLCQTYLQRERPMKRDALVE